MINAETMQTIALGANEWPELTKILSQIEETARGGYFRLEVKNRLDQRTIDRLELMGYKISYSTNERSFEIGWGKFKNINQ